jgi:predicted ArsR family transcriptional regulator
MGGGLVMPYENNTGWKGQETSKQAAKEISGKAPTLRNQVFELFTRGTHLTADEVAEKLGKDILSIRPRISELGKLGYIEATNERRKNASGKSAVVWAATASDPFSEIREAMRAAASVQELYDAMNTPEIKQKLETLNEASTNALKESYKYFRDMLQKRNSK